MQNGQLFIIQLIGLIGVGGFVGELQRAVNTTANITPLIFVANFLAGSFLSFMVAYTIFQLSENRQISFIVGGLLSYQEQSYIASISEKFLKHLLKEVKDE